MRKVDSIELYETNEIYLTEEIKKAGYEPRRDGCTPAFEIYPEILEILFGRKLDIETIRIYTGELEECVYKKIFAEVTGNGILDICVHWETHKGKTGVEEYTYCGKFFVSWAE